MKFNYNLIINYQINIIKIHTEKNFSLNKLIIIYYLLFNNCGFYILINSLNNYTRFITLEIRKYLKA